MFLVDIKGIEQAARRVLVVDPQAERRAGVVQLLHEQGLEVVEVETGEQALAQLDQAHPELVVTELVMPGMDGIRLAQQIKQRQGEGFIPIIICTQLGEEASIEQSTGEEWDTFIRRPYPSALLRGKVTAMLRNADLHRRNRQLIAQRQQEERIAEQLFSRAVERANVDDERLCLYKSPAETFSGDVVLSARRLDGALFFLLGDFTGHGLTTTIGALPLSETFRAMVAKGYDSPQILEQINRKLCNLLPSGMFLAIALVSISPDGRLASIVNAGLPDVLLVRTSGRVDRVVSDHVPLGIVSRLQQPQFYNTTLASGDRILVYSDGVIEARNLDNEDYGERRLIQCCAAAAPGERIVELLQESLRHFVAGQTQFDDISMIEYRADLEQIQLSPSFSTAPSRPLEGASGSWHWSLELHGQDLARMNPVAQAMNQLQECEGRDEKWNPVFTVLTELFVNALDHGVLGLSSSLKHSADGFMEYFRQRQQRLEQLTGGCVQISLQMTRQGTNRRLDIWVTDSGSGFDVVRVLQQQDARSESEALMGRGIALVSSICSQLNYFDGGSGVHAVFELH